MYRAESTQYHYHPSPTDFENFVPWACYQLSVEIKVAVIRTAMSEYVSVTTDRTKVKPKKVKKSQSPASGSRISKSSSEHYNIPSIGTESEDAVHIHTIYDQWMNLVQIKFLKNKFIPREVLKIVALIIPFYKHLKSLTIDSGLCMGTIYEISKCLPTSTITELILDNTNVAEANYHIILNQTSLKHMSLAKCNLNDDVVKTIAEKIVHPYPAAKTLTVLNLATNIITDLGAKHLAEALRSNRHLAYLNISDNLITDKGAGHIFDTLIEFPLTRQEYLDKKERHIVYLKERMNLFLITVEDIRRMDSERKVTPKKKGVKAQGSSTMKRKPGKEMSGGANTAKSMMNNRSEDLLVKERAEVIVEELMGPFIDAFDGNNIVTRDNEIYCHGNNTLCYLNIAYNDLTFISAKKLRQVLVIQQLMCRKPRGLVNVRIDGNYLPTRCSELEDIDDILESNMTSVKRSSFSKKKTAKSVQSKSISH